MVVKRENPDGAVEEDRARQAIAEFFATRRYSGKRVLLIIPDNSRSGPVGTIFQMIFDAIGRQVKALDVLVALGTHPLMTKQQIYTRLGISSSEHAGKYASVRLFNHRWDKAETFTSIGRISAGEIEELTDGLFSESVDVAINKLIFDYDECLIVGPVFPHEVVGFSGGHKYIFPGIAGAEIINFFHWLGAVITNLRINGHLRTPTRAVLEKAASYIKVPMQLFAIVAVEDRLKGLFIGNVRQAWEQAARLSERVHIVYKDRFYQTVVGVAPKMYEDLWTAGKVMYKLEPVVADGGTLIIYAPHIHEISYTHGKIIEQLGYHTRDYFLKQWQRFRDFPRGVLAHCTHVKGIGTYINGRETARVNVVLAAGIDRRRCRKINLGYLNPRDVDISGYTDKEGQGVLLVNPAGEMLYRRSDGYIPDVRNHKSVFDNN